MRKETAAGWLTAILTCALLTGCGSQAAGAARTAAAIESQAGSTEEIPKLCGEEYLSFFDAAAPIVTFESLDQDKVFFAARYGRGEDDYINCPMDKEQYELFSPVAITK